MDPQLHLLGKAAYLYYVQNRRQEDIASILSVSRSKVSRLLSEARDCGIVRITVDYPAGSAFELESALVRAYGLLDAAVLATDTAYMGSTDDGVARLAADYLLRTVRAGDVVALSSGHTLAAVMRALPRRIIPDVTAVPVVGSTYTAGGLEPDYSAHPVLRQFAQAMGATERLLSVPQGLESHDSTTMLLADSRVSAVLDLARRARVAVVGLGSVNPLARTIEALPWTPEDREALAKTDAVGEIAGRFFDVQGIPCTLPIDRRIIGMSLDALQRIPLSIGVAHGVHKAAAIAGAATGRYIKVLITDAHTAEAVLAVHGRAAA